jgi:hypothetical protein
VSNVYGILQASYLSLFGIRPQSHGARRSYGTNDMYLPEEMITKMNTISTVTGEFHDHNDPSRLFFTGWEKILKDHYIPIPSIENGYTKNYFYTFADGQVTMRQTVGSEVKYVQIKLQKEW